MEKLINYFGVHKMFKNTSFLYNMTMRNLKILFCKRRKCSNQPLEDNSIVWLGHATVLFKLYGKVFITDPVVAKYMGYMKRLVDVPIDISSIHVDYILLSHGHTDHINFPSLAKINKDAVVIAPKPYNLPLKMMFFKNIRILKPGDVYKDRDVIINTMEAIHDGRRFYIGKNALSNSYLVTVKDKSIFYAGDTAYTSSFNNISCDVALMPVGCYMPERFSKMHCSPFESYKMFSSMNCKYMIPIHYKTYIIALDDDDKTEEILKSFNDDKIKLLDVGDRLNL